MSVQQQKAREYRLKFHIELFFAPELKSQKEKRPHLMGGNSGQKVQKCSYKQNNIFIPIFQRKN